MLTIDQGCDPAGVHLSVEIAPWDSGSVAALDAQLILQGVVGLPLGPGVFGNDVTQFCAGKIQ